MDFQCLPIISDGCEILHWEIEINGETFIKDNEYIANFSGCKYFTGTEILQHEHPLWKLPNPVDFPVQCFSKPIDKITLCQIGADGVMQWAFTKEDIESGKFVVARIVHEWSGASDGREAYLIFGVV